METPRDSQPIVEARGIGKVFHGVRVLGGIDLDIHPGRVHALLGENGAGKTTFARIIAGVYRPTEGVVKVAGNPVSFANTLAAKQAGISLIHQEPQSFPHLSVAENISFGLQNTPSLSRVRWKEVNDKARALLDDLAVTLDETRLMGGLPIADQQLIEIATAFAQDSRVVIMDEPTSPLTPAEVKVLFEIVERLRDDGRAIVFISHRLEEVRMICDDYTVFRDGARVAGGQVAEVSDEDIIRMMIGRDLLTEHHRSAATDTVALKVEGLRVAGRFEDVSFTVHRGEVVGMAGLVGAGRTDVAQAIFGILPLDGGSVEIHGKRRQMASPSEAIANRIAYVPEDRARDGIFSSLPVAQNITAAGAALISRHGILRRHDERRLVARSIAEMSVRLASPEQAIGQLSGGNQQKVILARWLLLDPEILILDEPTRGIDIGVKSEFYAEIRKLAEEGRAIVFISSELPEILALSDRVLVMCEGRITAELSHDEASEERIMLAAVPRGTETLQ